MTSELVHRSNGKEKEYIENYKSHCRKAGHYRKKEIKSPIYQFVIMKNRKPTTYWKRNRWINYDTLILGSTVMERSTENIKQQKGAVQNMWCAYMFF